MIQECKGKRPVELLIDEAHDLNRHTFIGLECLMEVVKNAGVRLSVILAGQLKLPNTFIRCVATAPEARSRLRNF